MNETGIAFTIVSGALLLALPRRYAVMPLLLGAMYMTPGQLIEIGPANFTVLRLLVGVGILRVLVRGERMEQPFQPLDRLLLLWSVVLLATSAFHADGAFLYRAGLVWTGLGVYVLFRIFIADEEDIQRVFSLACFALLPIAFLMLGEKATGENPFGTLGGVNEYSSTRDGQVRASGPWAHPILAGTVGATCLAMAVYLLKFNRPGGYAGLAAGLSVLYACSSSGPALMAAAAAVALVAWPLRAHMRSFRWLAVTAMVALHVLMQDPFYFVIAKLDITGGSKSWHRAALIRSSIEHLDEWWLAGTDYTRHWMASGIHANANHTDITNHLVAMGVMGGLPLLLVFVLLLTAGFRTVGMALQDRAPASLPVRFLVWTLGAMLFAHLVNFFGISLFDQSIAFFYLVLAAIAVFHPRAVPVAVEDYRGIQQRPAYQ